MLCVMKNAVSLHRSKQSWCRSSVWLECLPVTQEVDGSSPFGTAKKRDTNLCLSFFVLNNFKFVLIPIHFDLKLITFEGFVVEMA